MYKVAREFGRSKRMVNASALFRRTFLFSFAALAISACSETVAPSPAAPGPTGGSAPANPTAPIIVDATVALLLPYGSADETDWLLATSLENGARMAAADLENVNLGVKVYNTSGTAEGAAEAAHMAIAEGADILLGPVRSHETRAVAPVAAEAGINLISFSNNTGIAGGNVFLLGYTYENAAERLLNYAVLQGRISVFIVYPETEAGNAGRIAVERALGPSGAVLAGRGSYALTREGIVNAVSGIADSISATQAEIVIFTDDAAGGLPVIAELLPESGVDPETVKFAGTSRWDLPQSQLRLNGLQGGWFTLPDPDLFSSFRFRYRYAYGEDPHWIASLAYDGVAAIGALRATSNSDPFHSLRLTSPQGFTGANGVFRFKLDGSIERGLAVAEIRDYQVEIVSEAPRAFEFTGF